MLVRCWTPKDGRAKTISTDSVVHRPKNRGVCKACVCIWFQTHSVLLGFVSYHILDLGPRAMNQTNPVPIA